MRQLVFELFLLIARHGVNAEDFKQLFKLFDTEHSPVVGVIIVLGVAVSCCCIISR